MKRARRWTGCLVFGALIVAAAVSPARGQCAMCRRALETPEGQALAAAYRQGILLLFFAPFVTFTAVALAATGLRPRRSSRTHRAVSARPRPRRGDRLHRAVKRLVPCRFSGSSVAREQRPR